MPAYKLDCKSFLELNLIELYKTLQLRQEVFIVEQNRDAQLKSLIVNELEIAPKSLKSVLHYNGDPINATTILASINKVLSRDTQSANVA